MQFRRLREEFDCNDAPDFYRTSRRYPIRLYIDQPEICGGCSAYQARRVSKHNTSPDSGCATAIALALSEMQEQIKAGEIDEGEMKRPVQKNETSISAAVCPECGAELSFEGGCNICKSCG